ncbi:MAG: hypothetical protein QG609_601 [Patescibacteria group bacterium]|nr:hypothetical protein [Patescibacteria group bacterium]
MLKAKTINQYIKLFPKETREKLNELRLAIKKSAPQAQEKISYQMPTFYLHGNLVHFAGYKNHIGFYPTPSGIKAFQKELAKYKGAKGSVQFPLTEKLPLVLIKKIVKYRVKENLAKLNKNI